MRTLGLAIALALSGWGFTLLAMRWDHERRGIPRDGQEMLGVFLFGALQLLAAGGISAVPLAMRRGPIVLAAVTAFGVALAGSAFALTRDFRTLGLLSAALLIGCAITMTPSERRIAAVIGAVGGVVLLVVAIARGPSPWITGLDVAWLAALAVGFVVLVFSALRVVR